MTARIAYLDYEDALRHAVRSSEALGAVRHVWAVRVGGAIHVTATTPPAYAISLAETNSHAPGRPAHIKEY